MDHPALIAFITGLTAGGLSCFAVQGGLLSASIAGRLEQETLEKSTHKGLKSGQAAAPPKFQAWMAQPILLFILAKLVAYTLLGFLLGWLGSLLAFTPVMQGIVQIAIAIFLLGNALRMLNVHPIFRYFTFEPPKWATRFIRRTSKQGEAWVTPLYLGALTVLIPCGVTQAVMAVAVGAGSPWLGALIMFAFVLGTSPTFVLVSWLAAGIGGLFQRYFYKAVGLVILVMGLYGLNAGLTLVGSPVSASKIARLLSSGEQAAVSTAPVSQGAELPSGSSPIGDQPAAVVDQPAVVFDAPAAVGEQPAPNGVAVARIDVENRGYVPDLLTLPAGQPVELQLVTDKVRSCALAFTIPELNIFEVLPESGEVVLSLPAQPSGKRMDFMCSMGMYTGEFMFQ